MIPFGHEIVTLYHRTELTGEDGTTSAVWSRIPLSGCSWRRMERRTLMSHTSVRVEETVCRIPAGSVMPSVGDVLIPGAVPDEVQTAIDVTRLLDRYRSSGAFRISSVADNARPGYPLPHYVAKGERNEDRLGVLQSQN